MWEKPRRHCGGAVSIAARGPVFVYVCARIGGISDAGHVLQRGARCIAIEAQD